ncbi:golgin subfamily A member 7B isoform X1 [Bos javanicus]|uniref:golgin subfamily A member 7B isoform X1 n=1 Tax=Bos javanicus TaxID=9906 RepID=UPI002AA6755E|nr:golgin subfamily A member 7B isoform X1 [Bos javanicus]XP_061259018.1 golgin subfamily A member 7B isoform X1 [Bos javanicus]XP_061259019.1 golgin subfamily A member 7B isoform X1 [Bos javanicus]
MATEVHNLQELRRSASLATKVFIQRDYSDGTICQFQTKFPPELDSRIERQLFEETVKTLNSFYAEAEKIGGSSYLEGCLACATAYFIFLCMETHYEKVLKKISRYIQEQNEKVFAPRGLLLTDPVERGMRVIEISIYEDRCSSGSSSSASLPTPPEKDPSLSNREFPSCMVLDFKSHIHQDSLPRGPTPRGCLPVCMLSDATTGPLPVCDLASTDSRSGETGVVSPLLTSSRLLASLSSTQSLEVILDSLRSVQLLRLGRPGAGGGGAHGLASGRLYGGPERCFMERCSLRGLEPPKREPTS